MHWCCHVAARNQKTSTSRWAHWPDWDGHKQLSQRSLFKEEDLEDESIVDREPVEFSFHVCWDMSEFWLTGTRNDLAEVLAKMELQWSRWRNEANPLKRQTKDCAILMESVETCSCLTYTPSSPLISPTRSRMWHCKTQFGSNDRSSSSSIWDHICQVPIH